MYDQGDDVGSQGGQTWLSRLWKATVELRPSTSDDAELAADWAEAKRHQYQSYAPVFWKPAVDARIRHRPFLEACLRSPDFTSFSAASDREALGLVLAPLLPPGWLIDDFYVARPALWHSVGVRLLDKPRLPGVPVVDT